MLHSAPYFCKNFEQDPKMTVEHPTHDLDFPKMLMCPHNLPSVDFENMG